MVKLVRCPIAGMPPCGWLSLNECRADYKPIFVFAHIEEFPTGCCAIDGPMGSENPIVFRPGMGPRLRVEISGNDQYVTPAPSLLGHPAQILVELFPILARLYSIGVDWCIGTYYCQAALAAIARDDNGHTSSGADVMLAFNDNHGTSFSPGRCKRRVEAHSNLATNY